MGAIHVAKSELDGMIVQMRRRIGKLKGELERLGEPEALPEMIQSTNIIRTNEHLARTNQKKSELLAEYDEYSGRLEDLLRVVFEIQHELKGIIKEQSGMIGPKRRAKKRPVTH